MFQIIITAVRSLPAGGSDSTLEHRTAVFPNFELGVVGGGKDGSSLCFS